jgi:hypothetical protein
MGLLFNLPTPTQDQISSAAGSNGACGNTFMIGEVEEY